MENRTGTGNYFLESITDFENISSTKMVQSNCMSISFINKGTSTVTINGLELTSSETIEVAQPNSFIDRTQYQVSFATGGQNNILVIRILPKNQS
tara:strand:+ start:831 stop:1115 length:285 start_codon:yes stop_codon:yes gene_type:complete